MTFDEAYEIALGELADGLPVAWADLARLADTPDRRNLVKQLQILGGVGATVGVAVESPPGVVRRRPINSQRPSRFTQVSAKIDMMSRGFDPPTCSIITPDAAA